MRKGTLVVTFLAGALPAFLLGRYFLPKEKQCPNVATASFEKSRFTDLLGYTEVLAYKKRYDDSPLLREPMPPYGKGRPYRGFRIDAKGLKLLRDSTRYQELYIRLGRKPTGEYTFMLLPLDAGGKLVQGDGSAKTPIHNYDNLEPCPDRCPGNFSQEDQF